MQEGFAFCQMIYDTSGKPDDWIYLNVNPAFNRLTGLADIVGRRVTDAIPGIKDQTPELFKTYSRVAQTGQPEKFEIHFTPLGIWLSISVFSPEKEYFVAVFDDITIRKQVEEKLRMSGEKFRLLVECAPHAIYIQTRSRFTYLNPEALRLFGASSPDELLAKLVIERFSPEDYAVVEDRIRLLNIERKPVPSREYLCLRLDNTPFEVEISLVPFLSGTENGALVFMRDITARKQAELTLSRRNDELNTANAQLAATAKELKQNYEELSDNQRQLI